MKPFRPLFYFTAQEKENYFHLNINNRAIMATNKALTEGKDPYKERSKDQKGILKTFCKQERQRRTKN